jgi:rubredoxin
MTKRPVDVDLSPLTGLRLKTPTRFFFARSKSRSLPGTTGIERSECYPVRSTNRVKLVDAGAAHLGGPLLFFCLTPFQDRVMKKWRCLVCDFEYDEAKGLPEEGIKPGTKWEDIPDSWTCPDCGASKADFQMVEV